MDTTAYRMEEITLRRKALWIVSLVFTLVVAAVTVNYGLREAQTQKDKVDLEDLARQIALAPNLRYNSQGSGYIKGSVIFINKDPKAMEDMSLPSEFKAERPQDFGTIILLDWSSERVGKYNDRQPAYVYLCTVSVIDRSIPAIVGTKEFRGSDPPSYKKTHDSAYGMKPTEEILSYVKGLPRK